jgi:antitoxin (DNA-binding transcriptional repressor) of toxin-antitoxin stability system
MSITIDIQDAKPQLQQLLALALRGDEVVIAENGDPMVKLAPVRKPSSWRTPGLHRGAMRTHDDFDAPLSDEFWLGAAPWRTWFCLASMATLLNIL